MSLKMLKLWSLTSLISLMTLTSCGGGGGGGGGATDAPQDTDIGFRAEITTLGVTSFKTPVGQKSRTLFKIENTGDNAGSVNFLLDTRESQDFSVVVNSQEGRIDCSNKDFILSEGEDCYLTVEFFPTSTGLKRSAIRINGENIDLDGEIDLNATLNIEFSEILPTGNDINFGNVPAGISKKSIISATNVGNDASGILFGEANGELFSLKASESNGESCELANNSLAVIAAGDTCRYEVTFSPVNPGDSETFVFNINNQIYSALGTGVAGSDLQPGTQIFSGAAFTRRSANKETVSQKFTITNNGPEDSAIVFERPNRLDNITFQRASDETGCSGDFIRVNETCDYQVSVNLEEPGDYNEDLKLGEYTLSVRAKGLLEGKFRIEELQNEVVLPLLGNAIDFGNKIINTGAIEKTLILTNEGESSKAVRPISAILDQQNPYTFEFVSSTNPTYRFTNNLNAGDTATYRLTYNPTTKTTPVDQANLLFATDNDFYTDGDQPLNVALSATPLEPSALAVNLNGAIEGLLDFGTITVNRENPSQTPTSQADFTIANNGDVAGSFQFENLIARSDLYSVSNLNPEICPDLTQIQESYVINPQSVCNYRVTLNPLERGSFQEAIKITLDNEQVFDFQFSYQGVFKPRLLVDGEINPFAIAGSPLDLGSFIEGQTNASAIRFDNDGDGSVQIDLSNLGNANLSFSASECVVQEQAIILDGFNSSCTGSLIIDSAVVGENNISLGVVKTPVLEAVENESLNIRYTGLVPASIAFLKDNNGTLETYEGSVLGIFTNAESFSEQILIRNDGQVESVISLSQIVEQTNEQGLIEEAALFTISSSQRDGCVISEGSLTLAPGGICQVDLSLSLSDLGLGRYDAEISLQALNQDSQPIGVINYSYSFEQAATFEAVNFSNGVNSNALDSILVANQINQEVALTDSDLYILQSPSSYQVTFRNTGYQTGSLILVDDQGEEVSVACNAVERNGECLVTFDNLFTAPSQLKSFVFQTASPVGGLESGADFYQTSLSLEAPRFLDSTLTANNGGVAAISGFKEDVLLEESASLTANGNGNLKEVTCSLLDDQNQPVSLEGLSFECPTSVDSGNDLLIELSYTPSVTLNFVGKIAVNAKAVVPGEEVANGFSEVSSEISLSVVIEDAPVAAVTPLTQIPDSLLFNISPEQAPKTFNVVFLVTDANGNPLTGDYEIIIDNNSDIEAISNSGVVSEAGEFEVVYQFDQDTALDNKIGLSIDGVLYEKTILAEGENVAIEKVLFEAPYTTITEVSQDVYQADISLPVGVNRFQVNVGPLSLLGTTQEVGDGVEIELVKEADPSESFSILDAKAFTYEGRGKMIIETSVLTEAQTLSLRATVSKGTPEEKSALLNLTVTPVASEETQNPVLAGDSEALGLWVSRAEEARINYPEYKDSQLFSFDLTGVEGSNPRCLSVNGAVESNFIAAESRIECQVSAMRGSLLPVSFSVVLDRAESLVALNPQSLTVLGQRKILEHGDRNQLTYSRVERDINKLIGPRDYDFKSPLREEDYRQMKSVNFDYFTEEKLANAIAQASIPSGAPSLNCWNSVANGFGAAPCYGFINDTQVGSSSFRTRSAFLKGTQIFSSVPDLFLGAQSDSLTGDVYSGSLSLSLNDRIYYPMLYSVNADSTLGAKWLFEELDQLISGERILDDLNANNAINDEGGAYGKSGYCDEDGCYTVGGSSIATITQNGKDRVEFTSPSAAITSLYKDGSTDRVDNSIGVTFGGLLASGPKDAKNFFVVNPAIASGTNDPDDPDKIFFNGLYAFGGDNVFVPLCDDGNSGAPVQCPGVNVSPESQSFAINAFEKGLFTPSELAIAADLFRPNYDTFTHNGEEYVQMYGAEYKFFKVIKDAQGNPTSLEVAPSIDGITDLFKEIYPRGRVLINEETNRKMLVTGDIPTLVGTSGSPFAQLSNQDIQMNVLRYSDLEAEKKFGLEADIDLGEGVSVSPREVQVKLRMKGESVNILDVQDGAKLIVFHKDGANTNFFPLDVLSYTEGSVDEFIVNIPTGILEGLKLDDGKGLTFLLEAANTIDSASQIESNSRYYHLEIDSMTFQGVW